MSIYIISNRPIVEKTKTEKEHFNDNGTLSALPGFRIAKWNDLQEEYPYELLPDTSQADYDRVEKAINGKLDMDSLDGTEQMFCDLYMSMSTALAGHADVLFFIHGFATSHLDEIEHIRLLKELYVDNPESCIQHLIYISWPTSNNEVLTYWSDKSDSITTGQNLARIYIKLNQFLYTMFKKYNNENCQQHIHIMAHSMGNQVFKQMVMNLESKYIVPFIGEILLLHADVSSNSFETDEPFSKLSKLGHRTHIYIHKQDKALDISTYTKNFDARLGKTGPSNIKNLDQQTYVVDCTGVSYKLPENSTFFTNLKIKLGDHWGYLYSPEEIRDIINVLKGTDERRIEGRKRHDMYTNYFYLESSEIIKKIN